MCDPILHFRLNPRLPGTPPLNRQGFRTRPLQSREPGVFRVLALGDSCTFGVTTAGLVTEPYPQRLEQLALESDMHPRVEVINAGMSGYTSWHGVMLLRARLRWLQPDLITVRYGWNDHWPLREGQTPEMFEERGAAFRTAEDLVLLKTALYPFAIRLSMQVATWENPPAAVAGPFKGRPYIPVVPLPLYRRHLARIVKLGRAMGAEVWLLTSPHALLLDRFRDGADLVASSRGVYQLNSIRSFAEVVAIHESYNQATREVAAEEGARLVDMDQVYRQHSREELFTNRDIVHPNQLGHFLEAQVLLDELRSHALFPGWRGRTTAHS